MLKRKNIKKNITFSNNSTPERRDAITINFPPIPPPLSFQKRVGTDWYETSITLNTLHHSVPFDARLLQNRSFRNVIPTKVLGHK